MKHDMTLLYAENDEKLLKQYTKYFVTLFENVLSATNGEMAYDLYKQHKPHILILDINMPKLDGLSLAKKIRKNDRTTKIIILTAYSNEKNLIEAIPLLLVDFLVKPVKTEHLLSTLNTTVKELGSNQYIRLNETYNYNIVKQVLIENDNKTITLTKNEQKLIEFFIQNPQLETVQSEIIINFIWNDFNYSMTRLRSLINRLNKKLQNKLLISYYGIGYKIVK